MNPEHLKLLRCPATQSPLIQIPPDQWPRIRVHLATQNGPLKDLPSSELLMTEDGTRVYGCVDGIFLLLAEDGIRTED